MASSDKISQIMDKLLACDYPFRWQIRRELKTIPEGMIERMTDQLTEKVFEDDFAFEFLMLYVGLAYENGLLENGTATALKWLETGENKLNEYTDDISSKNMCEALRHIILSTKVYLLLQKEDLDNAASIIADIPQVDSMDTENRAALHGLRAVLFGEYGIEGTKAGLNYASKAIESNPNELMWYFLKGKYLGRIRRVERPFDVPGREERELMEKAIGTEKKNAPCLVFLAQLYRETASRMFRAKKLNTVFVNMESIEELNQKALDYYDESLKLKPGCSHMMFRCAKGYIMLPPPFRNERLEQAETLLKRGLALAPDSGYGNHTMAQYYERIKKQPEEAIKHLEICEKKKIFGAVMDLLRLQRRLDESFDIVRRLTDLLNVYNENPRKCQLYSQLISYHIFVSSDLSQACRYAAEIIHLQPECEDMKHHRPMCVFSYEPMNLYDILIDEIKVLHERNANFTDEDRKYYDQFLKDVSTTGKEISPGGPQYLKNRILNPRSTRPARSKPGFNKQPYPNGFQHHFNGPPKHYNAGKNASTSHKMDFDRNGGKPFGKYQKDFINGKKNYDSNSRPASSYNWRSREQPVQKKDTPKTFSTTDEGTKPPETNIMSKNHASQRNDSEDSDDTRFRMMIYERSKAPRVTKKSSTQGPEDIVTSFKDMKLQDKSQRGTSKNENLPANETSRGEHFKHPNKNLPSGNRGTENMKHSRASDSNNNHKSEDHTDFQLESSLNALKIGSNELENDDDVKKRHDRKTKRSHRRRRSSRSEDRGSYRSADRKSKHYKETYSKRSEDEDTGSRYESLSSRQGHRRSHDRKSKRSHRRRTSSRSEDNHSGSRYGSISSRRGEYRSPDRKSKYHKERNSRRSEDEYESPGSKRGDRRSHNRKSKRSHRRRTSSRSEDDDRGSKYRSSKSRRSKHHEKRYSSYSEEEERPKSVRSRRGDHPSYDRESKRSYRKRNSSGSQDDDHGSKYESIRSRHERRSKRSHHRRESSRSEDDDNRSKCGSVSSRRNYHKSPDRKSKHSKKRYSSNDEDGEDRKSVCSRQDDDDQSKHSRKKSNSMKSEDDDNGSKCGSVSSRRNYHKSPARKSKHSKKRYSSNDEDGEDRKSVCSRQDDEQSKHSRKKSNSMKSEDDDDALKYKYKSGDRHRDYKSKKRSPIKSEDNDDDTKYESAGSKQSKVYKSKYQQKKNSTTPEEIKEPESVASRPVDLPANDPELERSHQETHSNKSEDEDDVLKHKSVDPRKSKRSEKSSRRGERRSSERESKYSYSRRKRHSSRSEDEDELERRSSRRNERYRTSSSSRRRHEDEGFASSRSHRSKPGYYYDDRSRNRDDDDLNEDAYMMSRRKDRDSHYKKRSETEHYGRSDSDEDEMSAVLKKISKKFEPKKIFGNSSK